MDQQEMDADNEGESPDDVADAWAAVLIDEHEPTRVYNDGPCFPSTPLAVEAEKVYRHGFARTAKNVPAWR